MTLAAGLVITVAALLYAIRELVRHLERTRHGLDDDFSIFRPYAKAPEGGVEDRADGTEGR